MPSEVSEALDALRKQSESIKLSHSPADQDQPRFSADNTSNAYEAESLVQGAVRNSIENPFEEFEDRFEPGVYVTYAHYKDGSTAFRRVRFKYCFPSHYFSFFCLCYFSFTSFHFSTRINKLVIDFELAKMTTNLVYGKCWLGTPIFKL